MAAVGLLIAGLALTAGGMTTNFIQAAAQRRAASDAEYDAEQSLLKAREKLDTNFYKNLSIGKEKYELEREALLSAGAQATAAGAESERGAAAVAGRVLAAQNQAQAKQRVAMGAEQKKIDMLIAQEDARLRDIGVQLDLEEVKGAQVAAGRAEQQANLYTAAGIQGIGDTLKAGVSLGTGISDNRAAAGGEAGKVQDQALKAGFTDTELAGGGVKTASQAAIEAFQNDPSGLQFKEMDFSSTFDIRNAPAMNEQGQSQMSGELAYFDALNNQLGKQGFKDFRKFLRGYEQPKILDNTGLTGTAKAYDDYMRMS